MGFKEAVRTCLFEKCFTFAGRASRSEYWFFVLFDVLLTLLIGLFIGLLFIMIVGTGPLEDFNGIPTLAWLPLILGVLFFLAMLVPLTTVGVRRFHDRNLSGWWYLLAVVVGWIPYVSFVSSIVTLVICVLKGTPGPNKFGRDPLGADTSADIFG